MSRITDLLSLAHVPRWTIVRHVRGQSVAEHSFAVACIARELYSRHVKLQDDSMVRLPNLTYYALTHDLEECVTGDIPTPAKKALLMDPKRPLIIPDSSGCTAREVEVVKLADTIEAYTWISVHGLGRHALEVEEHLRRVIYDDDTHSHKRWFDIVVVEKLIGEIMLEEGRLRV